MRLRLLLLGSLIGASLSAPAGAQVISVGGAAIDTDKIAWAWNNVGGATGYQVRKVSDNSVLSCAATPTYTESSLQPNASYSIYVEAATGGACTTLTGNLGTSPTVYTLAAAPGLPATPINNRSALGFTGHWTASGNTAGTAYAVVVVKADGSTIALSDSTDDSLAKDFNSGSGALPNSSYTMKVAAKNGAGIVSTYTVVGTTITLAANPSNLTVTANTPSSLSIAWDANGNPEGTRYQVQLTQTSPAGPTTFPIPFSSSYTARTATLTGLLTSTQYTIQVTAENSAYPPELTGPSLPVTPTTSNGGAPNNNFQAIVAVGQAAEVEGTFVTAAGRTNRVNARIPAGAFDRDVTVLFSSRTTAGSACTPPLDAGFTLTTTPAIEPKVPITLTMTVDPATPQTGSSNGSRFALVRYDPASNACVPLRTVPSSSGYVVTAQTNHFTSFFVQQVDPQDSLASRRVFPNPLYAGSQGYMTFDRLPADTRVRIYTLRGEEVFDERANASGIVIWKAVNKANRPVGSGVYLAVLDGGGKSATMKLVVVR